MGQGHDNNLFSVRTLYNVHGRSFECPTFHCTLLFSTKRIPWMAEEKENVTDKYTFASIKTMRSHSFK